MLKSLLRVKELIQGKSLVTVIEVPQNTNDKKSNKKCHFMP